MIIAEMMEERLITASGDRFSDFKHAFSSLADFSLLWPLLNIALQVYPDLAGVRCDRMT